MRRLLPLIIVATLAAGCEGDTLLPAASPTQPTAQPIVINITNTNTNTVDRSDTGSAPAPSGSSGDGGTTAGVLPLPAYGEGVARDYAAAHPSQVTHSCQLTDGEAAWAFLDGLIGVLSQRDARWGYLCKDANCLTHARDVVAYRASAGDTGIWIVDVLGNHCPAPGDSPTQVRWGVLPFETVRRWSGHR
jgi:hypothetical protein